MILQISPDVTFVLGMLVMALILVIISYFQNRKKRKCEWNDEPPTTTPPTWEVCEVCAVLLSDKERLNEDLQISAEGKINKFCSEEHFDIFFRKSVETDMPLLKKNWPLIYGDMTLDEMVTIAKKLMKEDREKFKPPQPPCPSVFRSASCSKLPSHNTLHWNKTLGYQWNDQMADFKEKENLPFWQVDNCAFCKEPIPKNSTEAWRVNNNFYCNENHAILHHKDQRKEQNK